MFKPKLYIPSNGKNTKPDNSFITDIKNKAISLLEWFGIDLQNGDTDKFLNQRGQWTEAGGGTYTAGVGIDITGNVINATGASTGQFNYFLYGQNKTTLPTPIGASVKNLRIIETELTSITGVMTEAQALNVQGNPSLLSITLSSLVTAERIGVASNGDLTTISFGSLASCNFLNLDGNAGIEDITLAGLIQCNQLSISGNTILEDVSLPLLEACLVLAISDNPALTGITVNANLLSKELVFTGNALLEAVVDNLLDVADDSGLTNGNIDLSGGTNAAPSVVGLASKTSLEGKGWTVTVN